MLELDGTNQPGLMLLTQCNKCSYKYALLLVFMDKMQYDAKLDMEWINDQSPPNLGHVVVSQ